MPPPEKIPDIGDETLTFLWKKIRAFLPYHALFYFLAVPVVLLRTDLEGKLGYLFCRIPGFFLVQRTGLFDAATLNSVEWYLSAMLLAMAILYPLARRWYNSFTHLFGPLAALFLLGYLYMAHGRLSGVNAWNGIAYFSLFRAVAELTLGMTCYEVSCRLRSMTFTGIQRWLLTGAEAGGYCFAMLYICSYSGIDLEFICLFAFCVAVTLSFSQQGILGDHPLFQHRLCFLLGRLSLPIYLAQSCVRSFVLDVLAPTNANFGFGMALCGTLVLGIASYALFTALQRKGIFAPTKQAK